MLGRGNELLIFEFADEAGLKVYGVTGDDGYYTQIFLHSRTGDVIHKEIHRLNWIHFRKFFHNNILEYMKHVFKADILESPFLIELKVLASITNYCETIFIDIVK